MKKRLLTSILVGVLTLGTLAGCGSSNKPAADAGTSDEPAKTTTEAAAPNQLMQQTQKMLTPLRAAPLP